MKIYVAHSGKIDFENELYKPLEDSEFAKKHEFFFPEREENRQINTKELIREGIDLLIAEISHSATGLGIEIGRAESHEVPLLGIYRRGHIFPNSLRFAIHTFIEYTDKEDMVVQVVRYVENMDERKH